MSAGVSTVTGPPVPLRRAWNARRITLPTWPEENIASVCLLIGAYTLDGEKLGFTLQDARGGPPGINRIGMLSA